MTHEIIESNKLIAEFMNAKLAADGNYVFPINFDRSWAGDIAHVENMKFHTSWDWLMPLVEKIEEMISDDNFVSIEYKACWIEVPSEQLTFEGRGDTKIEATYKAVVEFIKWYNENKK